MGAQATNVGKVASYVAKLLAEGNRIPALRGVGAASMSQALKAAVVAGKFVANDSGGELVLTPRLAKAFHRGKSNQENSSEASERRRAVEIVLRCRSVSASPHEPPQTKKK